MTRIALTVFVLGLLNTGCLSPAQRLDPTIVKRIREGVTTRDEVHKTLGKPRDELNGSNRKRLATYHYGRVKSEAAVPAPSIMPNKAGTVLLRSVSVIYDEHETVEKLLFHETSTPLYQQMSTFWIGQAISDKEIARIIKGASGEGELEGLFGPPMIRGLTVEGNRILAWAYVQVKSRFQLKEARQTLVVHLDSLGIVYDYGVVGNLTLMDKSR